MDIVTLAAAMFVFGLALYALQKMPLPASPPWLRQSLEVLLAVVAIAWLAQTYLHGPVLIH